MREHLNVPRPDLDVAQLWEDNAGLLYITYRERGRAGIEQCIGTDDAATLLEEYCENEGLVDWVGLDVVAPATIYAYPETQCIASYDRVNGFQLQARPGTAGRALLGPAQGAPAPEKE